MGENESKSTGFTVQRQKIPRWIVVLFIGVPAVACVVLLVILVVTIITGSTEVDDGPAAPSWKEVVDRAELHVADGLKEKKKGDGLLETDAKKAQAHHTNALKLIEVAQKSYKDLIEAIKEEHGGVVPPEYYGWKKRLYEIQLIKEDLIKTIGNY